jgi:phosphopantothenoylcysteine decarboxylase/phosphopantothenate--cysteine ligase
MSASDRTRVLLGVTGGIAAYKSPDVVRRLAERGADVQVAMTAAAKQFVTPLTFQAVSGNPTRDDLWDSAAEAAMGHIELARWAEIVLIAPASADFIARLAHGRADDLLSTLCLATDAPIAVAPAMNRLMWANPATQANIATLRERGIAILGPAEGDQACGEVGPGRMLEPDDLAERALQLLARSRELAGLHIVITAGPTREAIDPVRFISNRSSGKMGFATAQAARALGAKVTLISGPVSIDTPLGVRRIDVESAQDMYDAVHRELPTMDVFISAAAVADYRPPQVQAQKIKKSGDTMHLDLVKAPDILSSVSAHKRRPFVVGFAAETERVEQHAREKLLKKNLDMIAANLVGEGLAFDCDDNALLVLWPGGSRTLERAAKSDIARQLVALIVERFRARAEQSTRQRANV